MALIRDVYVIVGKGFDKETIVDEIKKEGYEHNFCFSDSTAFNGMDLPLVISEEVWTFGNCENKDDYKLAKDLGKDIWVMG